MCFANKMHTKVTNSLSLTYKQNTTTLLARDFIQRFDPSALLIKSLQQMTINA